MADLEKLAQWLDGVAERYADSIPGLAASAAQQAAELREPPLDQQEKPAKKAKPSS